MKLTIHTDGGARGNPGPAAIGIIIEDESNEKTKIGKTIGDATNNVAEYLAVLTAIKEIKQKYGTCEVEATFYLDSELVTRQLNKIYKIKNEDLKKIYDQITNELSKDLKAQFIHVRREQNKEADEMVNAALDGKI